MENDDSGQPADFCTSIFKPYFDFQPVYAEMAISSDKTCRSIQKISGSLLDTELCGYIFTQPSTDCGLFTIESDNTQAHLKDSICQANPLLPAEPVNRLCDTESCGHFITRVLAYSDWQTLNTNPVAAKDLIAFHSRYKYLVMAHSAKHYKSMGRLLGNLHNCDLPAIAAEYFKQLMAALSTPATRQMHSNTLMHLQGYLKNKLTAQQKAELTQLIHQYRLGEVPLTKPLSLLKQHLHLHKDSLHYAVDQVYLSPIELNVQH